MTHLRMLSHVERRVILDRLTEILCNLQELGQMIHSNNLRVNIDDVLRAHNDMAKMKQAVIDTKIYEEIHRSCYSCATICPMGDLPCGECEHYDEGAEMSNYDMSGEIAKLEADKRLKEGGDNDAG